MWLRHSFSGCCHHQQTSRTVRIYVHVLFCCFCLPSPSHVIFFMFLAMQSYSSCTYNYEYTYIKPWTTFHVPVVERKWNWIEFFFLICSLSRSVCLSLLLFDGMKELYTFIYVKFVHIFFVTCISPFPSYIRITYGISLLVFFASLLFSFLISKMCLFAKVPRFILMIALCNIFEQIECVCAPYYTLRKTFNVYTYEAFSGIK